MDSDSPNAENPNINSSAPVVLLQGAFVFALGSYLCAYVTEADFYFHLLIGRWIGAHHALPRTDFWTIALHGNRWFAENWIFDVLLAKTEHLFGWTGLAIFKLTLCILFVSSAAALFCRSAGNLFFGTVLAAVVACGVLEQAHFGPQLLALSLFTYLLNRNLRPREDRCGAACYTTTGLAAVLLANTHSAYLLALVCSAAILCARKSASNARIFGLLILCAFASPYFGALIRFEVFDLGAQLKYFLQTQSAVATVFDYSFSFLLLLWTLVACLARGNRTEKSAPSVELVLAGLLSISAFTVKYLLPEALILTAVVCARAWAELSRRRMDNELTRSFLVLQAKLSALPSSGVIWVLFCIFVVNSVNFTRRPNIDWLLPRRELDYVLEKNLPFPLWHESGVAPYVIYRLSDENGEPRKLAAIDFRAVRKHPEFLWEEKGGLWKKSFLQLRPKSVLARVNTALYEHLSDDPKWRLAFQGGEEISRFVEKPAKTTPFYAWAVFVSADNVEPNSAL